MRIVFYNKTKYYTLNANNREGGGGFFTWYGVGYHIDGMGLAVFIFRSWVFAGNQTRQRAGFYKVIQRSMPIGGVQAFLGLTLLYSGAVTS